MQHLLISATQLRQKMLGGISDMSLWRCLNDPDLRFPRPIYIGRRRYWLETEILAWIEERTNHA